VQYTKENFLRKENKFIDNILFLLEAEQKRIENARRGDMYAMHIIKNNFNIYFNIYFNIWCCLFRSIIMKTLDYQQ